MVSAYVSCSRCCQTGVNRRTSETRFVIRWIFGGLEQVHFQRLLSVLRECPYRCARKPYHSLWRPSCCAVTDIPIADPFRSWRRCLLCKRHVHYPERPNRSRVHSGGYNGDVVCKRQSVLPGELRIRPCQCPQRGGRPDRSAGLHVCAEQLRCHLFHRLE